MLQVIRKAVAKTLPESLKRAPRQWLFGYRRCNPPFSLVLEKSGDHALATVNGQWQLHVTDLVLPDVHFHFSLDPESNDEMHALMRLAKNPGGAFWDIGSHHGLFAVLFCLLDPANRAVCFEPSPVLNDEAIRLAQANALQSRIDFHNAAVGMTKSTISFRVQQSGFIIFCDEKDPAREGQIPMLPLDEMIGKVPPPAVLKIDVEGAELDVIKGATALLREFRPILMLEFHHHYLANRGQSAAEIVQILSALGYSFEDLGGRARSPRYARSPDRWIRRLVAVPSSRP